MSATHERDLRTGASLWAHGHGLGVPTRPLGQAISVDVAVIGAGISGAFMAHGLAKDFSVAVLDRRPPLMGSTIASTALLQWEIDLPLVELGEKIGPANARRAYARSRQAVDHLMAVVRRERIPCGVKPSRLTVGQSDTAMSMLMPISFTRCCTTVAVSMFGRLLSTMKLRRSPP